jgi:glutathione S-transferase
MTYELFIGDYAYSSWSLRGWLLFDRFGIPVRTTTIRMGRAASVARQLQDVGMARTVPTLRTPEGAVVSESLAIAEELASRHPEAGLWPADPLARATARSLAAEMHSGFAALRANCPMNLRRAYTRFRPPPEVMQDLRRIEALWSHARATCGSDGPWLCGDYSAADAFFAPVAARIAGFDLPASDQALAYVGAHLADPSFRRWRAMALAQEEEMPRYDRDLPQRDWPGPTDAAA